MTTDFARKALALHNKYRAHHNSPPLTWCHELQKKAQAQATSCLINGAKGGVKSGQNVFQLLRSGQAIDPVDDLLAIEKAVDNWYETVKDYNPNNPTVKSHSFAQLVWPMTSKLGVGIARKQTAGCLNIIITAFYDPPAEVPQTTSGTPTTAPTTTAPLTKAAAPTPGPVQGQFQNFDPRSGRGQVSGQPTIGSTSPGISIKIEHQRPATFKSVQAPTSPPVFGSAQAGTSQQMVEQSKFGPRGFGGSPQSPQSPQTPQPQSPMQNPFSPTVDRRDFMDKGSRQISSMGTQNLAFQNQKQSSMEAQKFSSSSSQQIVQQQQQRSVQKNVMGQKVEIGRESQFLAMASQNSNSNQNSGLKPQITKAGPISLEIRGSIPSGEIFKIGDTNENKLAGNSMTVDLNHGRADQSSSSAWSSRQSSSTVTRQSTVSTGHLYEQKVSYQQLI